MTTRARFACAALVSLALHGLVLSSAWLPVPQPPDEPRPLLARLVPPEAKPAAPRPPVTPPRRVARTAAPAPSIPIVAPAPVTVPEVEPDTVYSEPETEAPAVSETSPSTEPPSPIALAADSSAEVVHSLPRRGRITYTLFYGSERTYVGKVVQTWEVNDDGYLLASEAETGGIIELFRPQRLRHLSRGRITREGMRPESFLMSRVRRGKNETAEARFDWDTGSLRYGHIRDPKSVPLPAGTQDFMSFIYQYALHPPAPGRYRVPITTGTRFDTFEVEVAAEEYIETPLGTLRALPVRQLPRPGAESIQIWLAAEYRYLPVRIRHYDRQGAPTGEQLVNEIRISEE
jgi:hypothetical protein